LGAPAITSAAEKAVRAIAIYISLRFILDTFMWVKLAGSDWKQRFTISQLTGQTSAAKIVSARRLNTSTSGQFQSRKESETMNLGLKVAVTPVSLQPQQ
jgi:hypothetical protein